MLFVLVVGVLFGGAAVLLWQQWAREALVPAGERSREGLRRRALVAAVRPFGDANWRPAQPRRPGRPRHTFPRLDAASRRRAA